MGSFSDVKSVDDALSLNSQIISIYTQRQQQQLGAQILSQSGGKPKSAALSLARGASIVLEVEDYSTITALTAVPGNPASPGAAPKKPSATPHLIVIAQLRLDVVPSGDGFAQSIRYTFNANQSIHKTASGFVTDEFGLAPGDFGLDVRVVFNREINAQIKTFKDVLNKAKATSPFAPGSGRRVRLINAIDGQSFQVTQTSLEVRQSANDPNMAIVSISGAILYDYGHPALNVPVAAANPSKATAAQTSLISYTDLGTETSLDSAQSIAGPIG